jgi:hypothetical protein
VGGDEGEGELNPDKIGFVHPHLNPPPSKGEDIIEEILNIFA